tara:strand:+ start:232 stop:870 length:639 start_codon:yes stop_codon:yes gene_type:complete
MEGKYSTMNTPIILFGNGECPTHPLVLDTINEAKTVICLDGGADRLITLGYKPHYILGDLDSIKREKDDYGCKIIRLKDQNMTDLEKGLLWCYNNGIEEICLVGFSGFRDDHIMATFWILSSFAEKMRITLLSNYSKVKCVKDKIILKTTPGQIISLIPTNLDAKIKTDGLQYALNKEKLSSPTQGISNVAKTTTCTIEATDWTWVILNHNQ